MQGEVDSGPPLLGPERWMRCPAGPVNPLWWIESGQSLQGHLSQRRVISNGGILIETAPRAYSCCQG